VESFNGKLRDELGNRELFLSLPEARHVLDEWRVEYNYRRPHSGLSGKTPATVTARWAGPPVGAPPLPTSQPVTQQRIPLPGFFECSPSRRHLSTVRVTFCPRSPDERSVALIVADLCVAIPAGMYP